MWPFSSNSNSNNDKKSKWKEDRDETFVIDQDFSNTVNDDAFTDNQQYDIKVIKDDNYKNTFESNDNNQLDTNDDNENMMKDKNATDNIDDKEQQIKILKNKVSSSHTLQWIFAMANAIQGVLNKFFSFYSYIFYNMYYLIINRWYIHGFC